MAAEEKTESTEVVSDSGGGGGTNKIVLIISGVNILLTLGMIGVLAVSFQKENKKPKIEDIATAGGAAGEGGGHGGGEKKEGKEGEKGAEAGKKKNTDFGKMVTLEQFTVNLATPGSVNPKFVRVNIALEVATDDVEGEVNLKMPQVRNVIIDLFNSKRPSDLATADGRDYLKDEIKNAINSFLVTGKLKGVYFTSFALSS